MSQPRSFQLRLCFEVVCGVPSDECFTQHGGHGLSLIHICLVSAGLGIYDTMQALRCDVVTVACGMAASMGAILLAAGTRGKRWVQPHAQIMIHQPMGEVSGRASDVRIQVDQLLNSRKILNKILSMHTGQSEAKIEKDTMEDHPMNAQEALAYGIVDHVGDPFEEW